MLHLRQNRCVRQSVPLQHPYRHHRPKHRCYSPPQADCHLGNTRSHLCCLCRDGREHRPVSPTARKFGQHLLLYLWLRRGIEQSGKRQSFSFQFSFILQLNCFLTDKCVAGKPINISLPAPLWSFDTTWRLTVCVLRRSLPL